MLARPLSVFASMLPFQLRRTSWHFPTTRRERVLLSWAGLRGAVPVVLATVPADQDVFNLVFVLVVVFTLVQAPTLPWVARSGSAWSRRARRSGWTSSRRRSPGWTPTCCRCTSTQGSRLAGVEIVELSLPVGAAVTLVVRAGSAFVPRPSTVIQVGDDLLLVTTESVRSEVERRLRAVSRGGRLADWETPRRPPRRP